MSARKCSSSGFNMGGSVKSPPVSQGTGEEFFDSSSNRSCHDPSGSGVSDNVFGRSPIFSSTMESGSSSGYDHFCH
ncbi:hypothetical protein AMTR_s00001p00256810 [Amborella trichopoda]|nr:hypothetical protein AMTR_s00001p00256810 [Amborella trichopoda]